MERIAIDLYSGNNSIEIRKKASDAISSINGFQWACNILNNCSKKRLEVVLFSLQIIKHWIYLFDSDDPQLNVLLNLLIVSLKQMYDLNQRLLCVKIGECFNGVICRKLDENDSILSIYLSIIKDIKYHPLIVLLFQLLLEDINSTKVKQNILIKQLFIITNSLKRNGYEIIQFLIKMIFTSPQNSIISIKLIAQYIDMKCILNTMLIPGLRELFIKYKQLQDDIFDCVNDLISNKNITKEAIPLFLDIIQIFLKSGDDKALIVLLTFINSFGLILNQEMVYFILENLLSYYQININKIDIIHHEIEVIYTILKLPNVFNVFKIGNSEQLIIQLIQLIIYSSYHSINHQMNCIDFSSIVSNESQYKRVLNLNINTLEIIFLNNPQIIISQIQQSLNQISSIILLKHSKRLNEMELVDLTSLCYFFIFLQPKYIVHSLPFQELLTLYNPFFEILNYLQQEKDSVILMELIEQLLTVFESFYNCISLIYSNQLDQWANNYIQKLILTSQNCSSSNVSIFFIKTTFCFIQTIGIQCLKFPFTLSIHQQPLQFFSHFHGIIQIEAISQFLNTLLNFIESNNTQLYFIQKTFQTVFDNLCIQPLINSIKNKDQTLIKHLCLIIITFINETSNLNVIQKEMISGHINTLFKTFELLDFSQFNDDIVNVITKMINCCFMKLTNTLKEEVISILLQKYMNIFSGHVLEIVTSSNQLKTNVICMFIQLLSKFILVWCSIYGDSPSKTFSDTTFLAFLFCLNDIANILSEYTIGSEVFREGFNILFDVIQIQYKNIDDYPEFSEIASKLIENGIQSSDIEMVQTISKRLLALNKTISFFSLISLRSSLPSFLNTFIKVLISSMHSFDVLSELLYSIISSSSSNYSSFYSVVSSFLSTTLTDAIKNRYYQYLLQYIEIKQDESLVQFQQQLKYFVSDYLLLSNKSCS
ncbi:hypothetical protein KM1_006750 [Entamoeba histolytica HM-3:IMSS]|uniref:Uncharacterized protein n=1 Tax=Entamoeba histolytica HM-3:IMSS TaxID=885315 RepID=M7W476_ENTHI|nr:hypothetical protein KM1_006750 [Entamoeba histolytica HM-3:IMSS]